jgi:hypothetical protein
MDSLRGLVAGFRTLDVKLPGGPIEVMIEEHINGMSLASSGGFGRRVPNRPGPRNSRPCTLIKQADAYWSLSWRLALLIGVG